MLIEKISNEGKLLAIIVRNEFNVPGVSFLTDGDLSQQFAYMRHPAGKQILPHIHNPVPREVQYTQEVLLIKRGSLRVDFYTDGQSYLESRTLGAGDAVLLATGGHGFEVLEEIEMFEVKQGPYAGEKDKTRFSSVDKRQIEIKE
jgi:mannose-6-phosphate isomerase-like protein (cupin superfamily)